MVNKKGYVQPKWEVFQNPNEMRQHDAELS
jgi:hypothetical protein